MSALVGIVTKEPSPGIRDRLLSMMAAVPEYGTDGTKELVQDTGAFGFLDYCRTPVRAGSYPYHDLRTGLVVNADARLDNRRDLNLQLNLGDSCDDLPDAHYLLHAWLKWGEDCPAHLLGEFAFSMWDLREKRLFLARDHAGVKPLFYTLLPGGIAWASSIDQLLMLPGIHVTLDTDLLAAHLVHKIYNLKELTFFREIQNLPQGCSLTWQDGKNFTREYWNIRHAPAVHYQTEREYLDHLDEILNAAVGCRLGGSTTTGSHLSGGLDSTTVALQAHCLLGGGESRLDTAVLENGILENWGIEACGNSTCGLKAGYSWSPPGEGSGELELLHLVERLYGFPVRYCELKPEQAAGMFARDFTREPSNTLFSEVVILEQAQRDGVRTMLSGWGGDEILTFNGRGYFFELALHLRWSRILQALRSPDSKSSLSRVIRLVFRNAYQYYFHAFRHWRGRQHTARFMRPYLRGGLADSINRVKPGSPLLLPSMKGSMAALWENGHMANRMEDWHRQGAAYGIEYRYPLLDRRVVEFAMGIPDEMIYRHPWRGYLVRKYLERFIPHEKAWGPLKREDHRQPIFQHVLKQGLGLWFEQLVSTRGIQHPDVDAEAFLAFLESYNPVDHDIPENQLARRLAQVASLRVE